MERLGAHWVDDAEQEVALERTVFTPGGGMNPHAVGKTPQQLAAAGRNQRPGARAGPRRRAGRGGARGAAERGEAHHGARLVRGGRLAGRLRARHSSCCSYGGDGHSLVIHATDEDVVLAFGIEKPAFRILVNTWGIARRDRRHHRGDARDDAGARRDRRGGGQRQHHRHPPAQRQAAGLPAARATAAAYVPAPDVHGAPRSGGGRRPHSGRTPVLGRSPRGTGWSE